MPLIGTKGAASAQGFGLFAASRGSPAYLALTTSPNNNYINALTTDSQNNSILVGPNQGVPNAGAPIMKISPSGVIVWAKLYGDGSSGFPLFKGLACDSSDNIYAVGKTNGASSDDFGVLVKFDSSGNILWQRQQNAGSTGFYQRELVWESVQVMPNGNIVVGGTYRDFNRVFVCCCGFVKVAVDYFAIAVYNSSGTLQWRAKYGSTSPGSFPNVQWVGYSVGADSSNDVYITGSPGDTAVGGNRSIPILKYNSTGTFQWGYLYKNSASTISAGGTLAVGASGIYATSRGTSTNPYLLKVDSSGTFQWGRGVQNSGSVSWDHFRGSALDTDENFYATGTMRYSTGGQEYDYGTIKTDSSGTAQWFRSVGRQTTSSQDERAYTIAISADKHYCIGGESVGGITTELFTRLKVDGSQTGTYSVGGTNVQYAAISGITLTIDTAVRTLSSATQVISSGPSSLTYTETTPTNTVSNSGATISARTL
jgi:hypothetical protein